MNILLTNIWLDGYAGTEVYIRDLAFELVRRGHHVEVYSPKLGKVADEIKSAAIHICSDARHLKETPDIIHGHQYIPTMDAIVRFQDTPVIYFVHDRKFRGDTPPHTKRIIQYVAVDQVCREKLLRHSIPDEQIMTLLNWVDTDRFHRKEHIAKAACCALVFSNNASPSNYYKVIERACMDSGLTVEGIGRGFGNSVANPEEVLVQHDIIFAKGKAAIEAMASGAAVIVCDLHGLGKMVTPDNYEYFRKHNFGMNTMDRTIEHQSLCKEIRQYDQAAVSKVCHRIRKEADFRLYVDQLISAYKKVIARYRWHKFTLNRSYEEKILRNYLQCRSALDNEFYYE